MPRPTIRVIVLMFRTVLKTYSNRGTIRVFTHTRFPLEPPVPRLPRVYIRIMLPEDFHVSRESIRSEPYDQCGPKGQGVGNFAQCGG